MVRMDPETFHWLLELVYPLIQRKTTQLRNAIKAEVKLSLTLNYLAIGRLKNVTRGSSWRDPDRLELVQLVTRGLCMRFQI